MSVKERLQDCLRTFLLMGLLQLDLLVKGGQSLPIVLRVPSQRFKAVDLVFEFDQQLVIQREVIDLLYLAGEGIPWSPRGPK